MSAELDLSEVTDRLLLTDAWLADQEPIASASLKKLSDIFETPRSIFVDGLEIQGLPQAVQEILGNPKARYELNLKKEKKIANIAIVNLDEKGKGLDIEFAIEKDCTPFGFQFPQVNGTLRTILLADSRYKTILAAIILSKTAECFA